MIIYYTLCSLIGFFLVFPWLKVVASRFVRERKPAAAERQTDFGCIITAYKNADIAGPLVQSLLRQKHQNFHIYLVADQCDVSTWTITHPKFSLLHPDPPLNLKAKSIIYATERFVRAHEYTVIFDADNLTHPDFLGELNRYTQAGYLAVQGQRTAKNLDSAMACADATGEFYKNYVERYVPYLLRSSSVISGSGMAVETELYNSYLYGPEITRGKEQWKKMLQEDKILQNHLIRRNVRTVYAWDAIVYDEKVTTTEAVETQRSRWLYSYFQNIPNSLGILRRGLLGLRWNQLLFGIITIAPPLFIMLFTAFVLAVVGLFIAPWWSLALSVGVFIFALNLLWTLRLSKAPEPIWKTIWSLPVFVWNQIKALFKMADPNKNFKHTEHQRPVSIDEVLQDERL